MFYEIAPPASELERRNYVQAVAYDEVPCLKATLDQISDSVELSGRESRASSKRIDQIVKEDERMGFPIAKHPELLISKLQEIDTTVMSTEGKNALIQLVYDSPLFRDSRHIGMISMLNRSEGTTEMQRKILTSEPGSHEVSHNISKVIIRVNSSTDTKVHQSLALSA